MRAKSGYILLLVTLCLALTAPATAGDITEPATKTSVGQGNAHDGSMVPAWEFTARAYYCGVYSAVISPFRANFDNGIVTYSVGAPNYNRLLIVSSDGKTFTETTFARWLHKFGLPFLRPYDQVKPGAKPRKIAGLNCKQHLFYRYGQLCGELWTTQDIPTTNELADACCRFGTVPTGFGMPILYRAVENTRIHGAEGTKHERKMGVILEVIKADKKMVSADELLLPAAGSKKVAREEDIYAGRLLNF